MRNGLERGVGEVTPVNGQISLVRDSIPRRASGVAFNPSRVHDVPGQHRNNIDKPDECSKKKIEETTKKSLADHNRQDEGRWATLLNDPELG